MPIKDIRTEFFPKILFFFCLTDVYTTVSAVNTLFCTFEMKKKCNVGLFPKIDTELS